MSWHLYTKLYLQIQKYINDIDLTYSILYSSPVSNVWTSFRFLMINDLMWDPIWQIPLHPGVDTVASSAGAFAQLALVRIHTNFLKYDNGIFLDLAWYINRYITSTCSRVQIYTPGIASTVLLYLQYVHCKPCNHAWFTDLRIL